MIEDKLKVGLSFIGRKVSLYMALPTGGVQLQELTLKSARINKGMVLVDFQEYSNYIVNMDIVGTIRNNKFTQLYEEPEIKE